MRKRIAAGPINELDIRVGNALTVVVDRFAGIREHVSDAPDGYCERGVLEPRG